MNRRNVQCVIFDLDGTLVDAYGAVARSLNYALNKFGYPQTDLDTVRRRVGWGQRALIESFAAKKDVKRILALYQRRHAADLKNKCNRLPGAVGLLKNLKKRGCRLAVASNRPARFTRRILEESGLAVYFDVVLCADKVKSPKPAPDILKAVLKRFHCRPEEALYVGDMTVDIQSGQRAGVPTVVVTTGSSSRAEMRPLRPLRILARLSEVGQMIFNDVRERKGEQS